MQTDDVGIIILAAGASARLGQAKQSLLWNGKSLLQHAIDTANAPCRTNVVVVLGHDAATHRQHITAAHCIINDDWKWGMGNSLKFGIRYIMIHLPKVECVIIMVCDQPYVTTEHVCMLIDTYRKSGQPIISSAYSSTYGVPALFDKSMFNSMLMLEDNHGAKKIIEQHLQLVDMVNFPEAAIDIDKPEDLRHLKH